MNHRLLFFLLAPCLAMACSGLQRTQKASDAHDETVITDYVVLDTLYVTPAHDEGQKILQLSPRRTIELLHTSLDLALDWEAQTISGTAVLTVSPFAYPVDTLDFHAQGFDIHSVTINDKAVSYIYDGSLLRITPGVTTYPGVPVKSTVSYTAHPSSAAPSREHQGFHFIDPMDTIPGVPQQVWTIGQTQNNSQWFPTVDHPNERQTHDLHITIEDRFATLSNGVLISATDHGDGTRTDHWQMDLPHAPYLTVLVAGEFDVVEDSWHGIPVRYYVDPGYGASARDIFAHTPEMLTFFSNLLAFPYPWQKYDQVVVHDFTAGAMENTTAVTYSTHVQKHSREFLTPGPNDGIVAHEMIHHWFGNLLTCESWAQLVMNEGFANYGEYLWTEHKYGHDEAQYLRIQEMFGYFRSAGPGSTRPLIHFTYDHTDELFDAHSYNKGGLVLHMLRGLLGDVVFVEGLRKYIRDNAFKAVEAHHLRLAMEAVSGMDLMPFFDQWFFSPGHPVVHFEAQYDSTAGSVMLAVQQTQDASYNLSFYAFPLETALYYDDGSTFTQSFEITTREQVLRIPSATQPVAVLPDPQGWLLMSSPYTIPDADACIALMRHDNPWNARRHGVRFAAEHIAAFGADTIRYFLDDPHWTIRHHILAALELPDVYVFEEDITRMALHDADFRVRLAACELLGLTGEKKHIPVFASLLYPGARADAIRTGLEQLMFCDLDTAIYYAAQFAGDSLAAVVTGVAAVYAEDGGIAHRDFFRRHSSVQGYEYGRAFYERYTRWLAVQDATVLEEEIAFLKDVAMTSGIDRFARYYATYALYMLSGLLTHEPVLQISARNAVRDIRRDIDDGVLREWLSGMQ